MLQNPLLQMWELLRAVLAGPPGVLQNPPSEGGKTTAGSQLFRIARHLCEFAEHSLETQAPSERRLSINA